MGIINKSSYSESTQQLHIQNRYVQQNPESFSVHQQFGSRRACLQLQSEQLGDAYFLCQLPKFHFRLGFAHVQYIFEERSDEFHFPSRKTGLIMSLFISARNIYKKKKKKRKLGSLEKKVIGSVLISFNNNKATYYYLVSIIYVIYFI